jgi:hypothetical protein
MKRSAPTQAPLKIESSFTQATRGALLVSPAFDMPAFPRAVYRPQRLLGKILEAGNDVDYEAPRRTRWRLGTPAWTMSGRKSSQLEEALAAIKIAAER